MIRLALFDMDGTIVRSRYNWKKIREILAVPEGKEILAELNSREETDKQESVLILEEIERRNTRRATLYKGADLFLELLRKSGVRRALVTNNGAANAAYLVEKFKLDFDLVLPRDGIRMKPSPEPFLTVLRGFGASGDETLCIGDSYYDLLAARRSGIKRILIRGRRRRFAPMIGAEPELWQGVRFFSSYGELLRDWQDAVRGMSTRRH